jgi:hypothetical protein
MREYIDVSPSNGTGTASYKDGNPIVNFVIGAQERFLLGSTIRLNGKFTAINSKGHDSTSNLTTETPGLAMDPRLGVFAVIDSLSVSSHQTSQTIEHIKHYPRMIASYIPATSSANDLVGHMGVNALTAASVEAGKKTLVQKAGSEFSIPLPCGFFLGQNPVPLSGQTGVRGVNIQINLSPDSNIFFDDGTTGGTVDVTGAYYKLEDLRLTAELMVGGKPVSAYEYNSISSYYATINQSYATVNFMLGLKSVLAVWTNLIRSEFINNYAHNSLATTEIRDVNASSLTEVKPIQELFFTRGGKRFPLDYIISTKDVDTSKGKDPQISRNFLNSIVPFNRMARTLLSPYNTPGDATADKDLPDGGNVFGVGVALDTISNVGVDYSSEPFGMVVNSTLQSDTPHSCFVYVRSKQTLMMGKQGVQVVS